MRKALVLFLILLAGEASAAGPRAYGKKGSATTTNATVTLPFHPIMICIRNDDATNGLYVDWSDGVATAADESTNLYFAPGEANCYSFNPNKAPFETFAVGVLASAATAAYHINASRGN